MNPLKSCYPDPGTNFHMNPSPKAKMRLNIAVLFAWRALAKLRGSICNLIILDELLDSSLDEDGLDDVLKLLTNLTVGENV
jgi:hypothetical protein